MPADTLIVTDYRPLPEQQLEPPSDPTGAPPGEVTETETGVDVTTALRRALRDVPVKGVVPGASSDRGDRATTILFPGLPRGFTYLLTERVEIPGNRNVRLAATTPRGARLRSQGANGVLRHGLLSGRGHRVHVFENLVFHRAGVLIAGGARGMTSFLSCSFHRINTPTDGPTPGRPIAWAIQTGGQGVVGVRILDCEFSEMTGGGVLVGHNECDNWLIGDQSRFIRMGQAGVEIRSPSVHVRDARFESKLDSFGEEPFIRIADHGPFGGGQCRISGCRFGGEHGEGLHGPPKYAIDLTPDPPGKTITGVLIEGNWFFGHTSKDGPREDSAKAAIRVGATAHLCSVTGNFFRRSQYLTAVIDDARPPTPPGPGINTFIANAMDVPKPQDDVPPPRRLPTRADIFANGGEGWEVFPLGN
jgi:hypothetical protein